MRRRKQNRTDAEIVAELAERVAELEIEVRDLRSVFNPKVLSKRRLETRDPKRPVKTLGGALLSYRSQRALERAGVQTKAEFGCGCPIDHEGACSQRCAMLATRARPAPLDARIAKLAAVILWRRLLDSDPPLYMLANAIHSAYEQGLQDARLPK